jgi:benzoate 4-monooxygenase
MIDFIIIPVAAVVVSGLYVINALYEYYRDSKKLRRFHAVSISALTNAWMVLHQYFHTRTLAVDEAHRKYGKIVRIGPSHVSMASLQAIKDIYGHGTAATKDNFYGAFVSTHLNISDSQDKTIHNLKRKRFAVAFAQKSITELEYVVNEHLRKLVARLDAKTSTVPRETTDFRLWTTLLTYDITSVLLYSHGLNFLDQGNTITTAETIGGKLYKVDVDLALRESLRISTSLGWAPRRMVLAKMLTKWHRGLPHRCPLNE